MNLPQTATNMPLASSLGWAAPALMTMVEARPMLGLRLLTSTRARIHFVAFVLAMSPDPMSIELVDQALHTPMRAVLGQLSLADLRGVRRALGRITGDLLEAHQYRHLAALLADPTAAPILHHIREVTPELLTNLTMLPAVLRTHVIAAAIGHIAGSAENLRLWIKLIANRLPRYSDRAIEQMLGGCDSLEQLKAQLTRLTDELPALEAAPPKLVRNALRVDSPSAIRQLGRRFQNCLNSFLEAEIDGTSYVYHWRQDKAEAVCEIGRVGHVGWFLASHLGPGNKDLAPEVARAVCSDFAAARIYSLAIAETYDDLYFAAGRRTGSPISNDMGRPRYRRGRYPRQ